MVQPTPTGNLPKNAAAVFGEMGGVNHVRVIQEQESNFGATMDTSSPTDFQKNIEKTCEVLFVPSGRSGRVKRGMTLLEAARQLGVTIESACGGEGWCGQCAVRVREGAFGRQGKISSLAHLSPADEAEFDELAARSLPSGSRLACLARLLGDVCVVTGGEDRPLGGSFGKSLGEIVVEVDPLIRLCWLRLDPSGSGISSLLEQARQLLANRFGVLALEWEESALNALSAAAAESGGEVTLTLWNEERVLRVQAGFQERALGLAVDIGTTTLAVYLCDLRSGALLATASGLNPQIAWGADVISRIAFCNQSPDGLQQLQSAVIAEINRLAEQAASEGEVVLEDVVDCLWVGNSVMLHLALGLNPASLGQVPFLPVFRDALDLTAAQVGLHLNPGAHLHILPLIAGYVGADAVAAILAADLHQREEMTLLVDAGTNGEIVLGNRQGLWCTSSPTGPAFEGANITCGTRAVPGAIERVRIDPSSRQVRYKVIGSPLWSDEHNAAGARVEGICGSGVLEAVAEMYAAGLLLPNGRFNGQVSSAAWLRKGDGELVFVLAPAAHSRSGQPIYLTQKDVRAVQLAKAALRSGCDFLLRAGMAEKPRRILLAGAFGSLLDPQHAMRIGMIPPLPLEQVQAVGNAAGEGACLALLNRRKREEARQIARQVHHLVMPSDPSFQDQFVAALSFPSLAESEPACFDVQPNQEAQK
ncbi:ASKHA domain-containing protein [Bellilinea sp.]|uniref:ASKHA domain-containing protein n=1 Tax=Bellilinea sp. TaxID=2838785 RepID=UPI002ADE682E|nr:ASKHA domain-containing protein [Bellilinea sp.]